MSRWAHADHGVRWPAPSQDRSNDSLACLSLEAMQQPKYLYHLAEASNLPSILTHGLLSTERLTELSGMNEAARRVFLRSHRVSSVDLSPDITVRDQRPMPPKALSPALEEGLEPEDWYELLNGFVFLWPDAGRLERQRKACGGRAQVILRFDANALFEAYGDVACMSPINSGNARRRPARRSRRTLVAYRQWRQFGWPDRPRSHPPAEVLFKAQIPVIAPFLVDADPPLL